MSLLWLSKLSHTSRLSLSSFWCWDLSTTAEAVLKAARDLHRRVTTSAGQETEEPLIWKCEFHQPGGSWKGRSSARWCMPDHREACSNVAVSKSPQTVSPPWIWLSMSQCRAENRYHSKWISGQRRECYYLNSWLPPALYKSECDKDNFDKQLFKHWKNAKPAELLVLNKWVLYIYKTPSKAQSKERKWTGNKIDQ